MAKRGRKPFKPTVTLRRTVEEMRSCGESANAIARALRIDVDTLNKHFGAELANGLSLRRREVIGLLYKSARSGNVAAQKKLEEITARVAADEAAQSLDRPLPTAEPAKTARLGKKEEAARDASTAGQGTEWGTDLTPPAAGLN